MKAQQLVDNYAHAIYQAAFESWLTALRQAGVAFAGNPQIAAALADPSAPEERKRARLREALPPGASREMENALLLMASEGDLGLLDDVASEFERLVTSGARRRVAQVTTAVPPTEDEAAAIRNKLTAEFGSGLEFEFVVDRAILGGVLVHVAGRVIDDTVAGRLRGLRESLGVTER